MNYIKMSPLSGLSGYGGGTSGLSFVGGGAKAITWGADRGITAGGGRANATDSIWYWSISTGNNAAAFGDMADSTDSYNEAVSNIARGVITRGGNGDNYYNDLDYITIGTTGNSTDFGDLSESKGGSPGSSNGTRGLFWAGNKGGTNNKSSMIDYITIANTGNGSDFGDIWANGLSNSAACGDDTRGINAGGHGNYGNVGDGEYGNYQEEIEYVTYDTTSNSSDFGDLTQNRDEQASCSDMTIAVWAGGQENSTYDIIDYVTIQTTGNASDFGDLIHVNKFCSGTGDSVNGCICCGRNSSNSGAGDFIQYITYATPGNATDTCDALTARHYTCSISGE